MARSWKFVRTAGLGWLDFKFLNPKSGRVEKSTYVEAVDDLVLGCGIYRDDAPTAAAPVAGQADPPLLRGSAA